MAEPIRFFIDFVSTYSYFAAIDIDNIGRRHGRVVVWSVVSLPHVFQQAGTVSPLDQPLKLAHNQQDVARLAAMRGVALRRPGSAADVRWARRAFWSLRSVDQLLANRFALACMTIRFGQGVELNTPEALRAAADAAGVDYKKVLAAHDDESAAAALVHGTADAVSQGMFGAPFVRVGDQRFWGHDRCTQHLDRWLATGIDGRTCSA